MARFFPIVLLAAAACGCSAEWYRRSADDEVYAIVAHEQKAVRGVAQDLVPVEQRSLSVLDAGQQGEREGLETPARSPSGGGGDSAGRGDSSAGCFVCAGRQKSCAGRPLPVQGAPAPGRDAAAPARGAQ
jgi:hypothetical protein